MKYGYARVSSATQDLAVQMQQLNEFSCEKIYQEKVSARNAENRKEFMKLLEAVKKGDVIVVTKLDRFARSTRDALNIVESLKQKSVGLVVMNMGGEVLDTQTPSGRLLITMLTGFAEFEVEMNRERQKDGISFAKSRGVYRGRPKKFGTYHKGLQHALKLFQERDVNKMTVSEICDITKVGRSTLYNATKAESNEK